MDMLAERISRMLVEDFGTRTDDGDTLAARIVEMIADDRRALLRLADAVRRLAAGPDSAGWAEMYAALDAVEEV